MNLFSFLYTSTEYDNKFKEGCRYEGILNFDLKLFLYDGHDVPF